MTERQTVRRSQIIRQRLHRQGLVAPLNAGNEGAYRRLFRRLQPVAPVHRSRPGNPPRLVHRTRFDDGELTARWRRRQELIKGRFCGGRVGYVLAEDLEPYAVALQKPLTRVKPIHRDILHVIRRSSGISKTQLKDELPYSGSKITTALNRLQEAFLVYEHQLDTDWDTGWLDFATEWFDPDAAHDQRVRAAAAVLNTFLRAIVFATMQQLRDWSGMTVRLIKDALRRLDDGGDIVGVEVPGLGAGYMRSDDLAAAATALPPAPPSVFVLHKADMLVRAHASALRERYEGQEVLQYLLIDGAFRGALLGHWRIGPHDIDDIALDLSDEEAGARRDEVIRAVRRVYAPDRTAILKYDSDPLT